MKQWIGIIVVCIIFNTQESVGQVRFEVTKSDQVPDSLLLLDDIPDWIDRNIAFPEEAYGCGIVGIEEVCLSASWDGKVFITNRLNTLDPAYAKAIETVVEKAPRCRFAGDRTEDIYKYMLIDFSARLPEQKRGDMRVVSLHTPPRPSGLVSNPFNGREVFVEWIGQSCRIPRSLVGKAYADTVVLNYTVGADGRLSDVNVSDCRNEDFRKELERVIKRSAVWTPAFVNQTEAIGVGISDRVVVEWLASEKKGSFKLDQGEAFRNARTTPQDPNQLVLNPETQAKYKSGRNFDTDLKQNVETSERVGLSGSFVIEKDGSTTHIRLCQGLDKAVGDSLLQTIRNSSWVPACQGGERVRTIYSFSTFKSPKRAASDYARQSDYDIFGKHFLFLHTPLDRRSYQLREPDGSVLSFPFTQRGNFDYKRYYESMFNYMKNNPRSWGSLSDAYFNRLYRQYVK